MGDVQCALLRLDDGEVAEFDPGTAHQASHQQRPPSAYLNKFYYDCLTHSEAGLRMLIDTVGVDRVIFGTDWPADMAIDWPVSWLLSLRSLTQEEKEKILWKNLERLLGI